MNGPMMKDEGALLHNSDARIELEREAQNMGRIGYWLGSRDNARIYIATGVLLFALTIYGVAAYFDPGLRADFGKVLAAVAIGSLGFLGGSATGGSK